MGLEVRPLFEPLLQLLRRHEVEVPPLLLPITGLARGGRHGEAEHVGELLHEAVDECLLVAPVGGPGDHDGLEDRLLHLVGWDHVRIVEHVGREPAQAIADHGGELRDGLLDVHVHLLDLLVVDDVVEHALLLTGGHLLLRVHEPLLDRRLRLDGPPAEAALQLLHRRGLDVHEHRVHGLVLLEGAAPLEVDAHHAQLARGRHLAYRGQAHPVEAAGPHLGPLEEPLVVHVHLEVGAVGEEEVLPLRLVLAREAGGGGDRLPELVCILLEDLGLEAALSHP
mmetsp:Transcript_31064/g.99179  ORF Transcript_31064/g.99179 Transcript_31064/m.99179 type:complete len:281 (-) Transcript_31064:954-1796(-)